MTKETANDWSPADGAVACPWCNGFCMYTEFDHHCGVRIGADCGPHWEKWNGPENDAGGDYGRAEWGATLEETIADWNSCVEQGRATNQLGVW